MKVLLTGGLGFIGKNFLLWRPKEWLVVSLDIIEDKNFQKNIKNTKFFQINLTDKNQVKSLAKKMTTFDICLHLAANGDPARSVEEMLWDLRSTTETLINVGQNFKIRKLIYLSSGAVYNGNEGLVTPETKVDPILPYSISHYVSEQYTRFFQSNGQIKEYVIIRFFGAYGPYEPPRKIYTNLVKTFAIAKKDEFIIRGNGKNFIDAMYIEDMIEGLVEVIKSPKGNLVVDFCKGDHPDINELVKIAAQVFRIKVKIKHEGSVPEYNQFYASPKKFERIFCFKAKVSLEEGLKKLYEFYQKN